MSLKSAVSSSVRNLETKQNYQDSLDELKQEISNLFSQMQANYNLSTQVVNALFNMVSVTTAINSQNIFALEQSLHKKQMAFSGDNSFERLQDNIVQGQLAQENTNAAFSLSNAAQMQAQAAQNFANSAFAIKQRISDIIDNQDHLSSQESFSILSQADNLASSIKSIADSAQNYYYSMQNLSEQSQEKASDIYKNINEISNILD